jgi:hypothetical protein
MMPHLQDTDVNFVEQFQSTGSDSRLLELYVFAFFHEERLIVTRQTPAPDFKMERFDLVAYVEAVTLGPRPRDKIDGEPFSSMPENSSEIRTRLENEIPIRFGSPLFSKLKKEYWKLHDVGEWPLVIAIADLHAPGSIMWTGTGLEEYLYGKRHDFSRDSKGNLIISPLKMATHKQGNKYPSGFFFQAEAEHISAVIFSNSGTISKFTRMGKLAGFGDQAVRITRIGTHCTHDPKAALPTGSAKEVVPGHCTETWGEELSVYHNPRALRPLAEATFPSIAHHRLDNCQVRNHIPEFHPFGSVTHIHVAEPGAEPTTAMNWLVRLPRLAILSVLHGQPFCH